MVSLIKLSVVVAATIMLFSGAPGESVHVKGLQAGPEDAFLTRDNNPIKNSHPIFAPTSDRLDRS